MRMPVYYSSSQTNWSSDPKDGKVHGTRNIVEIKNGKGFKLKESLNKAGKVLERKKKTLKAKEIKQISSGSFVPDLWSDCKLGKCRQTRRALAVTRTRRHK
jgi:hypothetical protein